MYTFMSWIEFNYILFLTYFRHSYAGGKFRHTYKGLLFRKVAYTMHDVPCFGEMSYNNILWRIKLIKLPIALPCYIFRSDILPISLSSASHNLCSSRRARDIVSQVWTKVIISVWRLFVWKTLRRERKLCVGWYIEKRGIQLFTVILKIRKFMTRKIIVT
jgi:hypothetical protein